MGRSRGGSLAPLRTRSAPVGLKMKGVVGGLYGCCADTSYSAECEAVVKGESGGSTTVRPPPPPPLPHPHTPLTHAHRGGSGSQTSLSGSQHRRGRASGSSTHSRVYEDQQTLSGRAEDHRPERGAVKITGCKGWHSRSERQNRCSTDQRPEVGAIQITSAGTGAI